MSDYRWAPGWNVAYADLFLVNPQPTSPGLKATERTWGLSGAVFEQGPYAEWIYAVLPSEAELQALFAQVALTDTLSAQVTINTRKKGYSYARFNAIVASPQIGTDGQWDQFFPRGFVFLFTHLVALA